MKTLIKYQMHANLDGQTSALVLGETALFSRNRSLSKSEAGLNSIPSNTFCKSESFSYDDSFLKDKENDHNLNKISVCLKT